MMLVLGPWFEVWKWAVPSGDFMGAESGLKQNHQGDPYDRRQHVSKHEISNYHIGGYLTYLSL